MERFIEGQAFSRSYDLDPCPPPLPPPLPTASSTGDTYEERQRETSFLGKKYVFHAEEDLLSIGNFLT
jgi:hypothetical protein